MYALASFIKIFEKIAQIVDQTSEFSFGDILRFLENSMYQPMPTGLYTRGISIQKPVDSRLDKTRP